MRIAVAADELTGVAQALPEELRRRGHEPLLHGAYTEQERSDWAWASEAAARDAETRLAEAPSIPEAKHRRSDGAFAECHGWSERNDSAATFDRASSLAWC